MLYLKRVVNRYDVLKCDLTGKFIVYGDYYYEDDVDNKIISYDEYTKRKQKRRMEEFDYTRLNLAYSEKEYQDTLKKIERQMLEDNLLERPIFDQGHAKKSGLE